MKASVKRVMIFAGAIATHGKDCHGGFEPVIGNVVNDSVSWPAVGTVNERIEVSPVLRIKEFPEAIAAGCCVRRYEGCSLFTLLACLDLESAVGSGRKFLSFYLGNACQRRGRCRQFFEKMLEGTSASLHLKFYALRRVGYVAV
jgi:hypothetical protein